MLFTDRVEGVHRYLNCICIVSLVLVEEGRRGEGFGVGEALNGALRIPNILQQRANIHFLVQLVLTLFEHPMNRPLIFGPTAVRSHHEAERLPSTHVNIYEITPWPTFVRWRSFTRTASSLTSC